MSLLHQPNIYTHILPLTSYNPAKHSQGSCVPLYIVKIIHKTGDIQLYYNQQKEETIDEKIGQILKPLDVQPIAEDFHR
jgi:hypothetical protein